MHTHNSDILLSLFWLLLWFLYFDWYFLKDFNEEHAQQAFRKFDTDNNGYINAKEFEEIMVSLKSYLLTPLVQDNLVAVRIYSRVIGKHSQPFLGFIIELWWFNGVNSKLIVIYIYVRTLFCLSAIKLEI